MNEWRPTKHLNSNPRANVRWIVVLALLGALALILIWRLFDLMIFDRFFLEKQGEARSVRMIKVPAYRGMILDRHGVPLAVSTPVQAIWVNPQEVHLDTIKNSQWKQLSELLDIPIATLKARIKPSKREFIYLKRGLDPAVAELVVALHIGGLHVQEEFKRYYPDAEITAHWIGFTNVDDQGQEGLELAYNQWLKGTAGQEVVLKDRRGHLLSVLRVVHPPIPGHNLTLSMDRRIQYIAYRELKRAISELKATSGSVVVLDSHTGEVLAMVNQPSYNPNNRREISSSRLRNRVLTDTFEPGSVMKAFSVASALNSDKYTPNSLIDTGSGSMMVGDHWVRDEHRGGVMTVTTVLEKSSNMGVTKMTLSLPPENFVTLLQNVGFGESTDTGFPGESPGVLPIRTRWAPFALATLAFGYGLSVTPAQLAQAYNVIANHGKFLPITLLPRNKKIPGKQVMSAKAADDMLQMLHSVVENGSGKFAKVPGYQVGGKTGTSRIAGPSGYAQNRHIASFAGIAPISNPRLVIIVVINDPQSGGLSYYAATAAAPVFSRIMDASLKILNVPADNVEAVPEEISHG